MFNLIKGESKMNIDLKQSSETELLSYQIALQSIQIALNEQIRKVKDKLEEVKKESKKDE
tara:strand:+ start:258 stop:437 length:180 start_codon:yes stop_codon:yes gene_type:complete